MQPSQLTMLVLASAASSVVAQTTTAAPTLTTSSRQSQGTAQASIFIPIEAASALTAVTVPVSAIGGNPSATTYAIGCSDIARVPAIASVLCPSDVQTLTLTAGPSLVQGTLTVMTGGAKATAAISCNLQGTTSADCTSVVAIGNALKLTSTLSSKYSPTLNFLPVSITAGATDRAAPAPTTSATGSPNAAAAGYNGVSGMGIGIFGTVMGMLTTLFI